jgi:hypothetical protein
MKTGMTQCPRDRLTICSLPQAALDFWRLSLGPDLLWRRLASSSRYHTNVPAQRSRSHPAGTPLPAGSRIRRHCAAALHRALDPRRIPLASLHLADHARRVFLCWERLPRRLNYTPGTGKPAPGLSRTRKARRSRSRRAFCWLSDRGGTIRDAAASVPMLHFFMIILAIGLLALVPLLLWLLLASSRVVLSGAYLATALPPPGQPHSRQLTA